MVGILIVVGILVVWYALEHLVDGGVSALFDAASRARYKSDRTVEESAPSEFVRRVDPDDEQH